MKKITVFAVIAALFVAAFSFTSCQQPAAATSALTMGGPDGIYEYYGISDDWGLEFQHKNPLGKDSLVFFTEYVTLDFHSTGLSEKVLFTAAIAEGETKQVSTKASNGKTVSCTITRPKTIMEDARVSGFRVSAK